MVIWARIWWWHFILHHHLWGVANRLYHPSNMYLLNDYIAVSYTECFNIPRVSTDLWWPLTDSNGLFLFFIPWHTHIAPPSECWLWTSRTIPQHLMSICVLVIVGLRWAGVNWWISSSNHELWIRLGLSKHCHLCLFAQGKFSIDSQLQTLDSQLGSQLLAGKWLEWWSLKITILMGAASHLSMPQPLSFLLHICGCSCPHHSLNLITLSFSCPYCVADAFSIP